MKTVCQTDMCAGCGACVALCKYRAITLYEDIQAYNAVIDESKCINCDRCHKVCPQNETAFCRVPMEWYQGWSSDASIRANSSSGGLATAIATAFINNGGIVCTCLFLNGRFGFHFIDNIIDLQKAAGSKYVKSSPAGIYEELADRLHAGQKVLFTGLPCQVSAVLKSVPKSSLTNLCTIDLICHGTPSVKLLDSYLAQHNRSLCKIDDLAFRNKSTFELQIQQKSVDRGVQDNYTTAFLTSVSYTENCYHCAYAQQKRVSDLTLGDSWNSDLPAEEHAKGISLVLCQTEKGRDLLRSSALTLHPVDLQRAIDANAQLSHPAVKPEKRKQFFDKIKNGVSFNTAMLLIDPIREGKKIVKRLLSRIL